MIITLLRKPLEGTVAENTLKHGCGAINIDATRVGTEARTYKGSGKSEMVYSESRAGMSDGRGKEMEFKVEGRWPANFILLGDEARNAIDAISGHQKSGVAGQKSRAWGVAGKGQLSSSENGVGWEAYGSEGYKDEGGASRYFKKFKKEETDD